MIYLFIFIYQAMVIEKYSVLPNPGKKKEHQK